MGNSETVGRARTVELARPRWLVMGGMAIVLAGGALAWRAWQERQPAPLPQSAAETLQIQTVSALGRIEPQGEIVELSAPTALQESRIVELLVEEGDRVIAGQVVAVLDGRARLEAQLRRAEEDVRVARAELARVLAGAQSGELNAQKAEIARLEAQFQGNMATQRAAIARLEAEVENARLEAERHEFLHGRGAISASERDARATVFTTAQRQLQEAEAELDRVRTTTQRQIEQARATFDRVAEVRPVDIEVARATVEATRATALEAQVALAETEVRSPLTGQVLKIHTRPGETIGEEGIATLGRTQQMIAIADVYQSDIGKIRLGQPATVESPALDAPLQGTVERISRQVERQQVVNADPAANIDARVVEVSVKLDSVSSGKVANLTNLQVTTIIQVDTQESR